MNKSFYLTTIPIFRKLINNEKLTEGELKYIAAQINLFDNGKSIQLDLPDDVLVFLAKKSLEEEATARELIITALEDAIGKAYSGEVVEYD